MIKKFFLAIVLSAPTFLFASSNQELLSSLKANPDDEAILGEVSKLSASDPSFLNAALNEMSLDNPPSYVCALASAVSASKQDKAYLKAAQLLADAKGELEICLSKTAGDTKNPYAYKYLESNIEEFIYGSDKSGEKDLKKKIAAINSIWSLGEIGSPKVMEKLEQYYNGSDEVLRINIIFSMGKLKEKKGLPYLKKIATNTLENEAVRSAAYEMIDELEGK